MCHILSSEHLHCLDVEVSTFVLRRLFVTKSFTSADSDAGNGGITDFMMTRQVAVLNQAFNGSGFTFVLAGIDRVVNSSW